MMNIEPFVTFIFRRKLLAERRLSGSHPWTDDPILRDYRFCNVEREQDRGTLDLARIWRDNHADDRDLWFALALYRRGFNWGPTAEALGYPVPWKPAHYIRVMDRLRLSGVKWLCPAYTLPPSAGATPTAGRSYAQLAVDIIFNPLWARRDFIRPRQGDTLQSFYDRLDQQYLCRGFYAGQIVADLKYAQLKDATDWKSFAVPGPGSEAGLKWVYFGRTEAIPAWRKGMWLEAFKPVYLYCLEHLPFELHAQDVQNCLCEFNKYQKIMNNLPGRRRKFVV